MVMLPRYSVRMAIIPYDAVATTTSAPQCPQHGTLGCGNSPSGLSWAHPLSQARAVGPRFVACRSFACAQLCSAPRRVRRRSVTVPASACVRLAFSANHAHISGNRRSTVGITRGVRPDEFLRPIPPLCTRCGTCVAH